MPLPSFLPRVTEEGPAAPAASAPPYRLACRAARPEGTRVDLGGVEVGGERFVVIAGPCSVEGYEELARAAGAVRAAGAHALRGGAFKPRTSPYSFQGLGETGLRILQRVSGEVGLPAVTEAMDEAGLAAVTAHAAAVQIGSRNMQNYSLLRAVGRCGRPVVLKRGMSATVEEWLLAAEYVLAEGNPNVILCERGIRTFERATRNTLDLSAVAFAKAHSHLPVLVDPSHGVGVPALIAPMARAAAACGADGLLLEVHPNPQAALSDGDQALTPGQFEELMAGLRPILEAVGREL
jgi:3-deoxy-7-phosphoheptulonate synthase